MSETENLAAAMVEQHDLDASITATTDRRAALDDANYVLNAINVGGREPFEKDRFDVLLRDPFGNSGERILFGRIKEQIQVYGKRNP